MKNSKNFVSLIIFLTLLFGCSREFTEPVENVRIENGPLVYPGTTHVFDAVDTERMLNSISSHTGEINMAKNRYTSTVDEGHILMLGPSELTPYGALRKVTDITEEGDNYTFSTIQGNLGEAVMEGELTTELKLSQADIYHVNAITGMKLKSASQINASIMEIVFDDVDLTDGKGIPVILNGLVSLDISPEITIGWRGFKISRVETTIETKIVQDIEVSVSQNFEFENEIIIFEAYFSPIVIWGIVLVPKLELVAGYNGEFEARISASSKNVISNKYILTYEERQLIGRQYPSEPIKSGNVSISGAGNITFYTGPELSILVFGLVGPYANLMGNVTLEADIEKCPWWELTAGLDASLGLSENVFGIDDVLNPYNIPIADWKLAEANGCFLPPPESGIKGRVIDALSRNPVDNVMVSIGTGSTNNMVIINSTRTDNEGNYKLAVEPGSNYIVKFEKTGYLTNAFPLNREIPENSFVSLEAELQINNSYAGAGIIAGEIVNAFTGLPIGQANLELFPGKNSTSNQPVTTTTTNSNGQYIFNNIDAGHYTLKITRDGYISDKINVIALGGRTIDNQNGTLSPEMSADEWRIVLTWGSTPSDLDSHITGPISGTNRFHVYFSNENYSNGDFNANLDVDDTNSYGPETITLKNISNGLYRYSVHDYSNKNSSSSTALSNSGAKVMVYNGGQIIREFNVPPEAGTLWTVFEINNNMLIDKNTMSYESSVSQVKSANTKTDAELINNLPKKR
jgi:5-hydroxyisourate hydrolase-like protein (transthyretin family)